MLRLTDKWVEADCNVSVSGFLRGLHASALHELQSRRNSSHVMLTGRQHHRSQILFTLLADMAPFSHGFPKAIAVKHTAITDIDPKPRMLQ